MTLTEDHYAMVATYCIRASYTQALLWPTACTDQYARRGLTRAIKKLEGNEMLHYALVFFLIAIVAAIFGFGGISVASAGIAKILFFLFLIVFLVSLVMGVARRA